MTLVLFRNDVSAFCVNDNLMFRIVYGFVESHDKQVLTDSTLFWILWIVSGLLALIAWVTLDSHLFFHYMIRYKVSPTLILVGRSSTSSIRLFDSHCLYAV